MEYVKDVCQRDHLSNEKELELTNQVESLRNELKNIVFTRLHALRIITKMLDNMVIKSNDFNKILMRGERKESVITKIKELKRVINKYSPQKHVEITREARDITLGIRIRPSIIKKIAKRNGTKLAQKTLAELHEKEHKMVENVLALVCYMAGSYTKDEDFKDELIGAGNMGLMQALENYTTKYKTKFVTYASWWIKHYILRTARNSSFPLNIPDEIHATNRKIENAYQELSHKNNRRPTEAELAEYTGINENKVSDICALFNDLVLFEDKECNISLVETPSDEGVADYIKREEIDIELPKLPRIERDVISLWSGIGDGYPYMHLIIAQILGIDQHWSGVVLKKGLARLKGKMTLS